MANNLYNLNFDLADSSSESDESFHDLNADVALEDANSLKNNTTSDGDTASIGSVDKEDVNGDVKTEEGEEEDFKLEWTDTFQLPSGYLPLGRVLRRTSILGEQRRWKNIDWSTLLLFEGTQVGAFFGVERPHQIPPGAALHVRYQYFLLDEHDNVLMEGQSSVATFLRSTVNERVDNGFNVTFSQTEFLKHLRRQCVGLQSPGSMAPLVRIKVTVEEEFRPTLVPVGHNSKRDTGMVGLENLGATCYLNALLQMLFHINGFRRAVYKLPHEDESIDSSTTLALQNVFRNLQTSDREVTTKELTVAFGWTSAEAFLQQDVQEMMRVLVDKLEEKMTGTVVDGYIKTLMAGKVRSFICCVNVQYESKREEDYYDIQLDVKGCKNIYESFHKYTTIEMLDGENQYEAGEHGKQDARKGVIFESFPPVLTIHLKRFDFDLQTMNFTKIHDYFEFPLRLELDPFLAADSPATSRQQPNVYLLHSVLVHQGDVGGGHYYAYIRPTTKSYDYSGAPFIGKPGEAVKMAGKDQQWFKFNDETVLQVPQREAVDYCYGRRTREHEFLRSMSSAYMLVYIRESDAPDIMREVTTDDIPAQLGERLDEEQAIKKAKQMRTARSRWFSPISYATEKELAEFRDYSRFQDFINEKALISLDCMRDTNKLGVLLSIAHHLRRSPADLRLWEIEKRDNSPTLGVSDEIGVDELTYRIKEMRFYVEFVDYCGTAEERIEYEQTYLQLREAEKKLVEEMRAELVQIEDLHYAPSEDPVLGCGIGCGNLPLLDLKNYSSELYDFYSNALAGLEAEMMELLKHHHTNFTSDQMLTFVKVYDPYNYLPIGGADSSDESLQSASSDDDDDGTADTDTGEADVDAASEYVPTAPGPPSSATKQRSLVSKPKAPEYLPVKYLGSQVVNVEDPIASLAHVIDQLVRRANPFVPEGWQADCLRFRYYYSEGPTRCKAILPKLVDNFSFRTAQIESNSLLIYVDILPEQPPQLQVPYGFLDAPSWLTYRAYKKTMQIRPFDQREVRILLKRQRGRVERERAASMDVEGCAVDNQATAVLSTGSGSAHGTPIQSMRRPVQLRDRTNSIGSAQRDRTGSVSSLRDRANSIGSELGMSPSRLGQSLNPKTLSGKPFTLEVPLQSSTKLLFRRVAQELAVEGSHLVLHIVNFGHSGWEDEKFYSQPICLASDLAVLKIMDTLKKLELNIKANARYCIFYRLVPFPLVNSVGIDQRLHYKFTDFLIVDERIRYWRRMFLEHLRSTAHAGGGATPAGTAAGDIVTAEEGSTPKRSRTHSDGNGNGNGTSAATDTTVQKPREAVILWPDTPKENEYDLLEVEQITAAIPTSYMMREVNRHLRGLLGIPKNYRELEALKYADGAGHSAQQAEVVPLLRSSPSRGQVLEGSRATSTDELAVTADGSVSPAFPLLITVIRFDVVNEILSGSKKMFVHCRSEASESLNHLFSVGLQHVTAEDSIFMRNKHPRIRSMVLSVFSFTLTGQMAVPLPCREYTQGGGPFVSYIREDDDYQSLARRLAAITGDSKEEWWKMRLAITTMPHQNRLRLAHFLPQPSSRGATPAPTVDTEGSGTKMEAMDTGTAVASDTEEEGPHTPQKDDSSEYIGPAPGPTLPSERAGGAPGSERLWDIFCRDFPGLQTFWQSEFVENGLPPFAQLGIQRSVVDVASKSRSKRAGGGSIKIV